VKRGKKEFSIGGGGCTAKHLEELSGKLIRGKRERGQEGKGGTGVLTSFCRKKGGRKNFWWKKTRFFFLVGREKRGERYRIMGERKS